MGSYINKSLIQKLLLVALGAVIVTIYVITTNLGDKTALLESQIDETAALLEQLETSIVSKTDLQEEIDALNQQIDSVRSAIPDNSTAMQTNVELLQLRIGLDGLYDKITELEQQIAEK